MLSPLRLFAVLALFAGSVRAEGLARNVEQLIVGVAPGWDSSTGTLRRYERDGARWRPVGEAWPVLFGKNGLAWGRGLLGTEEPGRHKTERDGRAPAGAFRLGTIYTYDAVLPEGAEYPFHTITAADAWVDDASSPDYNRHVTIPDPAHPPAWFEKAKMRHGDFAYRWLVEIRHNADPPVSAEGERHLLPPPPRAGSPHGRLHYHGRAESHRAHPLVARREEPRLRAAPPGRISGQGARLGFAPAGRGRPGAGEMSLCNSGPRAYRCLLHVSLRHF